MKKTSSLSYCTMFILLPIRLDHAKVGSHLTMTFKVHGTAVFNYNTNTNPAEIIQSISARN